MSTWALPWVPKSINHQYVKGRMFVKGGGTVPNVRLDAKLQAWRDEVILIVRQSGARLPEGDLSLSIWWQPPTRGRHDVDGLTKAVQDAIFLAFQADDYQVCENHVYRRPYCKGGKVIARLAPAIKTSEEDMPL